MNLLKRFACLCALVASATTFAADVGTEGDGDFKIGPDYTDAPELKVPEGVPRGTMREFTMKSEDSKLYPGLKGSYTRKVWVYIPTQYVAGRAAPFMVVQDAMARDALPKILDTLIPAHKLPAMVVIFISSGGGDGKGSERGYEYDAVTERYAAFIETEVLPRVTREFNVTFTKDPEGRATMGGSSGAACAFTMAWFHPELYRRVLSYSGTFVDQQSPFDPTSPHGAWEYHEHLIAKSEVKPLRIYLEVGENDNGSTKDEASYHNWVMANHRMAAVLKAKGYHYRFEFAEGAKHVDGRVVKQTLAEAMLWLWRGYPVK